MAIGWLEVRPAKSSGRPASEFQLRSGRIYRAGDEALTKPKASTSLKGESCQVVSCTASSTETAVRRVRVGPTCSRRARMSQCASVASTTSVAESRIEDRGPLVRLVAGRAREDFPAPKSQLIHFRRFPPFAAAASTVGNFALQMTEKAGADLFTRAVAFARSGFSPERNSVVPPSGRSWRNTNSSSRTTDPQRSER